MGLKSCMKTNRTAETVIVFKVSKLFALFPAKFKVSQKISLFLIHQIYRNETGDLWHESLLNCKKNAFFLIPKLTIVYLHIHHIKH